MTSSQHAYEVRPRKDHRGVDLISDALPFGRLWYGEPNAASNAIGLCAIYFASLVWDSVCALPYRHRRDCGAPKPGKKKQNRYDYGYAILIVHSFLE